MTVEHLIGHSQGGYLKDIRAAVAARFPELSSPDREALARRIDELNTVSACSFCNSTTSRNVNEKSMAQLLNERRGTPADVEAHISKELQLVLRRKREEVEWKIASVREAFQREIVPQIKPAG